MHKEMGDETHENDVVDPSDHSSSDDGDEDGDGSSVTSSLDFLTTSSISSVLAAQSRYENEPNVSYCKIDESVSAKHVEGARSVPVAS